MVTFTFCISCDQRSVLLRIKEKFSQVEGVSITNGLFFLVLQTFRTRTYFGNEEQKTFPVVYQPNLIGRGGKIMHMNIERNEIEFANAS